MARSKPAFAELLLPHAFADLARHDGAESLLSMQLASAVATHMLPEVSMAAAFSVAAFPAAAAAAVALQWFWGLSCRTARHSPAPS
jgi:hypothetical protein